MKTFQQFQEDIGKMPIVNVIGGILGAGAAIKGAASYLGKKAGERSIKKKEPKKSDPIKDLVPNIKKRNKALEDAMKQM